MVRLTSESRFSGTVDVHPLVEALSKIPGVVVLDGYSRECGYTLGYRGKLYGISSLGMEEVGTAWFFNEHLRGEVESNFKLIIERFKMKPPMLIDPIRTDGIQGAQRRLFVDTSKIDVEIFI